MQSISFNTEAGTRITVETATAMDTDIVDLTQAFASVLDGVECAHADGRDDLLERGANAPLLQGGGLVLVFDEEEYLDIIEPIAVDEPEQNGELVSGKIEAAPIQGEPLRPLVDDYAVGVSDVPLPPGFYMCDECHRPHPTFEMLQSVLSFLADKN